MDFTATGASRQTDSNSVAFCRRQRANSLRIYVADKEKTDFVRRNLKRGRQNARRFDHSLLRLRRGRAQLDRFFSKFVQLLAAMTQLLLQILSKLRLQRQLLRDDRSKPDQTLSPIHSPIHSIPISISGSTSDSDSNFGSNFGSCSCSCSCFGVNAESSFTRIHVVTRKIKKARGVFADRESPSYSIRFWLPNANDSKE